MSGFGKMRGRPLFALLLVVLLGLTAAACGGGDSDTTATEETATTTEETGGEEGGGATITPTPAAESASYLFEDRELGGGYRPGGVGDDALTEKSIKAGEEAGEEVEPAKLPSGTIGVINFLNGIESSDRLADTVTYGAAELGWDTIVCDGKGTPSQFIACGNSLLAQGVAAIVDIAVEPGAIQPVLNKAKQQGVPVVQAGGGGVPTGDLSGNYGPDEALAGELLTEAIFEELEPLEGNPEIVVHNFPAKWGAERTEQLEKAVSEQDKIKIADNVTTDAADLVPYTERTDNTQITQYPDAKAYWFTFDTTGQVGGGVISSKYPGKEFPEKPLVGTFHGDLSTLGLMAQGDIDVISEVNYDMASLIALDGIAKELAREEQMPQEIQPEFPVIGQPLTYAVVTAENLPPEGEYVPTEWDVPAYFVSKWRTEYGL